MDELILCVNKLQDQFRSFSQKPVDLPQIIVVGSQSTGKSSVLESLVRRPILPRGIGMITRCPLILRLVHCPKGDKLRKRRGESYEEWGEFDKDGKIYDIGDIKSEIERRTEELAGVSKNISYTPIVLTIFSPHVLTLTLVAVEDQPADIEDQIVNLINQFIKNPKSIILAVITANTDMATHECLKMAMKVDPDGTRTIAVVTKLDIMDKGIIGVVNRSQEDINNGKSIEDTLRDEDDFLQKKYPALADTNGSKYLAKKLQELLIKHIINCVPAMTQSLLKKIEACKSVLAECGTEVRDEKACLDDTLNTFCQSFIKIVKGEAVDVQSVSLTGGAKICSLFKKLDISLMSVKPCEKYCLEQVILAIRQTSSVEPPLLFSERAFDELMRPLLEHTRKPSLLCIDEVSRELKSLCRNSIPQETATRFPAVAQGVTKVVDKMIDDLTGKTKEYVLQSIYIEEQHITRSQILKIVNHSNLLSVLNKDLGLLPGNPFKSSPAFIKKAKLKDFTIQESLNPATKDVRHCIILGDMLNLYYGVIANRIQDTVAKATMAYLVNGLEKSILLELATQLGSKLKELFVEENAITKLRTTKQEELKILEKSLYELQALNMETAQ
ncbi:hypothetical protein FOCC_FOCC015554 [Frankliniella occidentalis]|nr:hypothetical protein FOCC_FOCC015554 [Frankliniella occidentalis]